jgi:hypothetical protein
VVKKCEAGDVFGWDTRGVAPWVWWKNRAMGLGISETQMEFRAKMGEKGGEHDDFDMFWHWIFGVFRIPYIHRKPCWLLGASRCSRGLAIARMHTLPHELHSLEGLVQTLQDLPSGNLT